MDVSEAAETSREHSGVAYTLAPPPGGAALPLLGAGFVFGAVLWARGALVTMDGGLASLGGVVAFLFGALLAITFIAVAPRRGAMARRFAPYRGLRRAPVGVERLIGNVEYRAEDHIGSIIADAKLPLFGRWRFLAPDSGEYWEEFKECAGPYPGPLPRTVAEESLRDQLLKIPLTRDLLEPEAIVTSRPFGGRQMLFVAGGYSVFALWMIAVGRFATGVSWLVMGALLALTSPGMRRFWRSWHWEAHAPIAGCGVIKTPNQRRWVATDAMMVVQARMAGGGVYVTLIGPAGVLRLTFESAADPDFVALWERWNHLNPQPELLE